MLTKDNIGLKWEKRTNFWGIPKDSCKISPQKARALMNKAGRKDQALPSPGFTELIGRDMFLLNYKGQYSVECLN